MEKRAFALKLPDRNLILMPVLVYMIRARFSSFSLCLLALCFNAGLLAQTASNSPAIDTNAVKAEMDAAIHQVEKIVCQTVPAYRVVHGMHVSVYKPGWFHEGATKPNFNTVDVRTTRETAEFDKHEYCSSDLNPGLAWRGRDLEFNSMTKYFYTNRTFPKKRLTEAEMVEINRLYRIIGKCEQQLNPAPKPEADSDSGSDTATSPEKRGKLLNPYIGVSAVIVLGLILVLVYKLRS
jgi:hypothetical protein